MLRNPILFQQFGIAWTVAWCWLFGGLVLMCVAAALFTILFRHLGAHTRELTPEEADHVAFYAGKYTPVEDMHGKHLWGRAAELSWNIDTLRKAANRGDWFAFWTFPTMFSLWMIGMGCVFMAMAIWAKAVVVIVATAPILALMVILFWFMAWAAIYTNIDADADDPAPPPRKSERS
jgi:hypothetical protein